MGLNLFFLGHPRLMLEDTPVDVNRRSVLALLAYLTINESGQVGQKHSRESLSALFWPDYDQARAFSNLRHTLWETQKALGPGWLSTDRDTVGLSEGVNMYVDVRQFEALLQKSAGQHNFTQRIPVLSEAVEYYRNHFLAGFSLKEAPAFNEWALTKSEDLRHKLIQALSTLAEDYCALGQEIKALSHARRLVGIDPLNEFAQRQLMEIYLQTGQHNAALKHYQNFERLLRKELNLDPQPETRALYKQIRKGEKTIRIEKKIETVVRNHNLPQQLTSFIGREKEQTEIINLLARKRLVTLTGTGGIGKTRLSLQVAAEVIDDYPDGVWFIELASLADPGLIPQNILSVLHLGEQAGKTHLKVLEEQLNSKKLLLILDNCEHLVEACARVIYALLMSSAEIKVLATSRETLDVKGELAWRVPSLALPDPKSLPEIQQLTQYESVRLFIERALLVQPHFKVDQSNAADIAWICFRLDGIPLAIELAAARVRALSVDQIARRLEDRFRLLSGDSRVALERHQTLHTAIDWSYNLLTADEKKLLGRLSVFMGGWTLEAAEQVCLEDEGEIDILEILARLIDKSLVIMDGSTGTARYYLLETTRQYAREKMFDSLEAGGILRNQHLAYFLDLAEKSNSEITGPHQAEVIDLLDAEHDNFRAALDWCLSNRYTEAALLLLGALGWAWDMRGYYNEARSWYEKICVLGDLADYPRAYARVLSHIGHFASDFDHRAGARSLLEESQTIWLKLGSEGEQGLADVYLFLGMDAEINDGNIDEAESFYTKCLGLSQGCGNRRMQAASLMFLGRIETARGNIPAAINFFEQSLQFARQVEDLLVISLASGNLGSLFVEQDRYEKARPLIDQNLKINEKLKFRFGLADAWFCSGDLYRRQGDYVRAEQCFEKSMSFSNDLGMKGSIGINLYSLALLALHRNDYPSAELYLKKYFDFVQAIEEKIRFCVFFTGMSAVAAGTNRHHRCAKLFGAAQAIFDTVDFRLAQFDRAEFDRHIHIARDRLGNTSFELLSNEGCNMTIDQAIDFALEKQNN